MREYVSAFIKDIRRLVGVVAAVGVLIAAILGGNSYIVATNLFPPDFSRG